MRRQPGSKPLNPYARNFTPRNALPPYFRPSAALQPFPAPPPPPPPPPQPHLLPYYYYFTYYSTISQQLSHSHHAQQNPHMDQLVPRLPEKHNKNVTPTFSTKKNSRNKHQVVPLRRDEDNTTIMIKNIPYDCHRKELITVLDDFCLVENKKAKNEGTSSTKEVVTYYAYDFIYLPIDFRTKKGRGFAFVNFTNVGAVWKFFDAFHHKHWYFVHRQKKLSKQIEIVSAKLQGKEALVNHFGGSVFECETDEFLPALFRPPRDGSGQPVELTVVGNRTAPPLKAAARYSRWGKVFRIKE